MVHIQSSTTVHQLFLATVMISLVIIFFPALTSTAPIFPEEDFEYKKYCSNTLSDAIRLICGGRYNSLARQFPDSIGSTSYRYPQATIVSRLVADETGVFRPLQSGPIHECCRRPCGYSELKMYCAPDK